MSRTSQLQVYAARIGKPEKEALIHAIKIGRTYDGIAREIGFPSANSVRQALLRHKLTFKRQELIVIEEIA